MARRSSEHKGTRLSGKKSRGLSGGVDGEGGSCGCCYEVELHSIVHRGESVL